MTTSSKSQVASQILEQLHEHFREGHRKRDQVIAFYFASLAAVLATWKDLGALRGPVTAGSTMVGFFVLLLVLRYRVWHFRYICSISTFQRALASDRELSVEQMKLDWRVANDTREWYQFLNPLASVESATYFIATTLVGVSLHVALHANALGATWRLLDWTFFPFLANVGMVYLLGALAAACALPRALTFPPNEWMFRWMREEKHGTNVGGAA